MRGPTPKPMIMRDTVSAITTSDTSNSAMTSPKSPAMIAVAKAICTTDTAHTNVMSAGE